MQGDSTYQQDVLYVPIARHTVIVPAGKMKFLSSGLLLPRIAPWRVAPASMLDGESAKGKEWRRHGAGSGPKKQCGCSYDGAGQNPRGAEHGGQTMAKSSPAAYRPTGWPVLRTPRWMLAAAAVLVAGLVLVAIPHRPSTAERAADLRGMVSDLTTDVESCAGGVTDSLTALRAIESGTSHDVKTAATIANTAAANCSPGNNMQMEDLVQYQVPESLASFNLDVAVNDLVTLVVSSRATGSERRGQPGGRHDTSRDRAHVRAVAPGPAGAGRAAGPDRPAHHLGQHGAVRPCGTAQPAQLIGVIPPERVLAPSRAHSMIFFSSSLLPRCPLRPGML